MKPGTTKQQYEEHEIQGRGATTTTKTTPKKTVNGHQTMQQTMWDLSLCAKIKRIYFNEYKGKIQHDRVFHLLHKRYNLPYHMFQVSQTICGPDRKKVD